MVSHKLSQIYKQYPCSVLSLFIVKYNMKETTYDKHYYFWYNYRPFNTGPFTSVLRKALNVI